MTDSGTDAEIVTLSERAARRITEIVLSEDDTKILRIGVIGGGCSGFQYTFNLEKTTNDDDIVIVREGAMVAIDSESIRFLAGAEIDYVDELIGASFQIKNPNATAACGCGTSFSI